MTDDVQPTDEAEQQPEEETESAPENAPALDRDGFICPRCGVWSHMRWGFLFTRQAKASFGVVRDSNAYNGTWKVATCERCGDSTIWRDERMIYPAHSTMPPPHAEMPSDARAIYEEAREVVAVSPRAGAALARAALERALKTLDPVDGRMDLADRIDRILPRVSAPLYELLTVVRHSGNKSLHAEEEPDDLMVLVLDPEQVEVMELIFAAVNDLVDELVARPKVTGALVSKLPIGVQKRIEQARTKAERGSATPES